MWSLLSLHAFNRLIVPSVFLSIVLIGLLLGWPIMPASPAAVAGQKVILPVGTVLPVSLEHPLSSKELTKGEAIEGRIMQDVPLPNQEKIPAGSKIHGTILNVVRADKGAASITFRLDSLELRHLTIPVLT